jgi:serine/threonine protein phosphatase 1
MFFMSSGPRTFAIGDVHGCARELELLIAKLKLKKDDTIIFLGDYVDRGPDAKSVISIIIELKKHHNVIALKGNHEAMFLDFLERPESPGAGLFVLNGGSATLASYAGEGGSFEIPDEHIRFLYDLKYFYETPTHFFVHAGVPPNRSLASLAKLTPEDEVTLLWIRQLFLNSSYDWGKIIVHGHTPVDKPETKANRINVDTGCVYDGMLTAVELPKVKFHHIEKGEKGEDITFPREVNTSRAAMRFSGRLAVHASVKGKLVHHFETLNYNQFGLLMAEAVMQATAVFKIGDVIEGRIAPGDTKEIGFIGEVVRTESRGGVRLYAVKMTRVANGDEGHEWIERPEG